MDLDPWRYNLIVEVATTMITEQMRFSFTFLQLGLSWHSGGLGFRKRKSGAAKFLGVGHPKIRFSWTT